MVQRAADFLNLLVHLVKVVGPSELRMWLALQDDLYFERMAVQTFEGWAAMCGFERKLFEGLHTGLFHGAEASVQVRPWTFW